MGNTNSTPATTIHSANNTKEQHKSESDKQDLKQISTNSSAGSAVSSTASQANGQQLPSSVTDTNRTVQPFKLSVTEPISTGAPATTIVDDGHSSLAKPAVEPVTIAKANSSSSKDNVSNHDDGVKELPDELQRPEPTKAVPVSTANKPSQQQKTGWLSSTGGASPWFSSLSSSTSSSHHPYNHQHRASISGPYYRTRGMSVSQNENEDDLNDILASSASPASTATSTASTQQHHQPSQSQHSHTYHHQHTLSNQSNVSTAVNPAMDTSINEGVPTIITWTQGGNNVYVTGTFNGWKHKIKLVKSTHDFSAVLDLPPGTHRLKFIVDDEWKCSNDMETATDPDGNLVNYLQVLDEGEENDDDEEDDGDTNSIISSESTTSNDHPEAVKKYSNVIPSELLHLANLVRKTEQLQQQLQQLPQNPSNTQDSSAISEELMQEKRLIMEWEKKQPQPPALPPHLDKVLLNSGTVSEEDNSVLHEPNHVTLNHLYACSIKDNVMALATTARYRKKYVTTMYYRPVES